MTAIPNAFSAQAVDTRIARHAEVARRYAWATTEANKNGARSSLITRLRLSELERLFYYRWGFQLPDDDAGRDDFTLAAHHITQLGGEIVNHIVCWASLWTPWMPQREVEALAEKIAARPLKFKAATLGWRLRLTEHERSALAITTIRAFGITDEQMAERRKQYDRERKRQARQLQRTAKPEALCRSKPWLADGISRATWYRRRKVGATHSETKRVRTDGDCLKVNPRRPIPSNIKLDELFDAYGLSRKQIDGKSVDTPLRASAGSTACPTL